jgi:hypothetical protein
MSGRARIVEALATVEGINAHPSAPDAPVAGDAWPRWVTSTYAGKLSLVLTHQYDVLAILPAGYAATTVEQADGLLPMLSAALAKVGTLATAEPVSIQVADSSTMPGLRIRMTPREATR